MEFHILEKQQIPNRLKKTRRTDEMISNQVIKFGFGGFSVCFAFGVLGFSFKLWETD